MAAPRRTAGLVNFTGQLDRAFPARRKPDGWIADGAHGVSDHQPDDVPGSKAAWNGDPDNIPDVRAVDVSDDLGPGVSMWAVCDHLAGLPGLGLVVRYFIYGTTIWHVRNGFRPVRHTGAAHPTHLHVSFAWTEAADDNTTFNYRLEEVPVSLTETDKKWLEATITRIVDARIDQLTAASPLGDGTNSTPIGHVSWNQGIPNPYAGQRTYAWQLLEDIAMRVGRLQPPTS
jgi:hypothetical protein